MDASEIQESIQRLGNFLKEKRIKTQTNELTGIQTYMIYTGRNCRVSWINHSTELLQFKDTLKFTIEYFATFI